MLPVPLPANEAARLQSLRDLQILDTAPEAQFDALVKVASLLCSVPISLISLIDADRKWLKASVGFPDVSETPSGRSFCSYAILVETIFEVRDATLDPRFSDNPLVTAAPHIRFYAGAPLRLSSGECVGTLCVIDRQPRQLDAQQRDILTQLAFVTASALEGRRALASERRLLQEQAQVTALLRDSEARFRALSDASPLGVFAADTQGNCTYSNALWQSIFGLTAAQSRGQAWTEAVDPQDRAGVQEAMQRSIASGSGFDHEFHLRRTDGTLRHVHAKARPILGPDNEVRSLAGVVQDITARKHAELAAARSTELLNRTGALAKVGGWELVVDGMVPYWSAETYRIHGVDPSRDVSFEDAIDFFEADAQPVMQAAVRCAIDDAIPWDIELPVVTATGQSIWVRTQGRAMIENGKVVRLAGVVQDITAQHKANAHARLMETCISRLNEMVIITEAEPFDGPGPRIVFVNDACERITGYSRAEVLDKSPRIFQGVNTQRSELDRIRENIEKWQPVRAELLNYTKSGREIWLDIDIVPIANDKGWFTHWIAVERDITERKRAERALADSAVDNARLMQEVSQLNIGLDRQVAERTEALARQEALFRTLAEQAPQVIWTLDLTGNLTYINQAWLGLVGGTLQDWTGEQWIAAIHPEDRPGIRASWLLAQAGGQPFSGIRRVLCQDGSVHTMSYRGTPVRDERGVVIFWVGIDTDVTEFKLIEVALRQRNQELASSECALRELASRQMAIKEVERQRIAQEIHDELGQRLTVLRMDVAMLPRAVQANAGLLAPSSINLLKDQIDDVLAVVRDLAGKLRPAAIDLGLSVAAESLIENFQTSLGIPCTLRDQLPAGLALDEPRTLGAFRILQESLTNVARHAQANSIHITLMVLDDQLVLRVRDDGRGFTASAQHGQPGFGLTGMRERATALGGRVDVASEPGHGTTVEARFSLHCPLQSALVLPPGYNPLDLVPLV